MDWLQTIMPAAATLLGGPAVGIAVKFLAEKLGVAQETVDSVSSAITSMNATPEGKIKLAEIDADLRKHAMDIGLDLDKLAVANAADINKTMQVEAAAEHWPTYTWRPFIGFVFGIMFIGTYFVLPLLKLPVPVVPTEAWLSIGSVLGVASWYRGKMQADPTIHTVNRG